VGRSISSGRFGEEINRMSEQVIVLQGCCLAWSQYRLSHPGSKSRGIRVYGHSFVVRAGQAACRSARL
jgi:hypothetical protein